MSAALQAEAYNPSDLIEPRAELRTWNRRIIGIDRIWAI